MPFNGSGTFSRLYSWTVDAANNVAISSSRTDAELNGMASGLSNCVTRDGQSPPSADLPMGGKKLVNLGNATVSTDALNMATGDTRYILATGATNLTLSDTLTAAVLSLSGNATVGAGGTLTANGPFVANGTTLLASGSVTGNFTIGVGGTLTTSGPLVANGTATLASVAVTGNGTVGGTLSVAGAASITGALTLTAALAVTSGGTGTTSATGTGSLVLSASPALTGTPTAPTAAAGTATTQLATTAFVDTLRDVPSNAKTVNYPLALPDRGGSVDFNGASLTCTIPANSSVAFPVGTVIVITNLNASNLSIAITTDTLTISGSTTTGTRTLGQNGEARLRKVGATSWLIAGTALT